MSTTPRLIAIIGATGTGKSELAVSLARRFNGEILNADAMQLYEGLPIITNKISVAEQHSIPHHLLGTIPLSAAPWTVSAFVAAALASISSIRARGHLPILVGGTHYYTQAVLFAASLAANDAESDDEPDDAAAHPLLSAPTDVLLAELAAVDPVMAKRWHPRDRRKIQRSLAIYLRTGRPASALYAAQAPPRLRCPTLVLWPHAGAAALPARLDARVDAMLAAGLEDEVRRLAAYRAANPGVDASAGIWVAIGYKEFVACVAGEKARAEALEETKAATRRYAKRQVRWIRLKLGPALKEAGGSLYLLDSSEVARFGTDVVGPAEGLVERWLAGEEMPDPLSVGDELAREMLGKQKDKAAEPWTTQTCEVCDVVGTTESDWRLHVASRRHKKLLAKAKQGDQHADRK